MAKSENRMRETSPLSTSPKCKKVFWPRPAGQCGLCRGKGGLATPCVNCKAVRDVAAA